MIQVLPRRNASLLLLALSDCQVLTGRAVRHLTRNPEQLFQVVLLPVILLMLFRYMFGGAIKAGGQSYVDFVVPGLLVLSVAFNSTVTTVGVAGDLRDGIVERFRSMPVASPAVLVGHVMSALLRNAISVVILLGVGVGVGVGFTSAATPAGWLAVFGILLLFVTAWSWLAVVLGTVSKTVEGASGLSMILVFIPYASSALVPVSTMPRGLSDVVGNQPVTPVIDSVRSLLAGTPGRKLRVAGCAVVAGHPDRGRHVLQLAVPAPLSAQYDGIQNVTRLCQVQVAPLEGS